MKIHTRPVQKFAIILKDLNVIADSLVKVPAPSSAELKKVNKC